MLDTFGTENTHCVGLEDEEFLFSIPSDFDADARSKFFRRSRAERLLGLPLLMVSLISLVGMLLFRLLILLYPIVTNARQLRSNRIDEQYLLRWSEEGKLSDGISYVNSIGRFNSERGKRRQSRHT